MRKYQIASNLLNSLFSSTFAPLVTRPWLDKIILSSLHKHYFPTSRLWASACVLGEENDSSVIDSNIGNFWQQIDIDVNSNSKMVIRAQKAISKLKKIYHELQLINSDWSIAFFDDNSSTIQQRLTLEELRLEQSTAFHIARRNFNFLIHRLKQPVILAPYSPEYVQANFGHNEEQISSHFSAVEIMPKVEESKFISLKHSNDSWLRFKSPCVSMDDMVYARVYSPKGISNPPTVIFGHGICVDFDHYSHYVDELSELSKMGIRIIRPEAPWHGRRAPKGRFGGEHLLSTAPGGMFDFISAQHQEWSVLIDWCRKTSTAPVAIGGSSLGAQTAKVIAVRAKFWPKHLQPDALFISTHCRYLADAATDGALSDIWNLSNTIKEKGWTREITRHHLEMLDLEGLPVMPANNIVSVLGRFDQVTPFYSGQEHLTKWGVPAENQFEYNRGHFTVPLGLRRNPEPLYQLKKVLENIK